MTITLSTKDKIKVRVSKERVERWNKLREVFATQTDFESKNPTKKDGTLFRGRNTIRGGTLWEKEEVFGNTTGCAESCAGVDQSPRSMADKLMRMGSTRGLIAIGKDYAVVDMNTGKVVERINTRQIVAYIEDGWRARGFASAQAYLEWCLSGNNYNGPTQAKARPDSPFKRPKQAFTVERKNLV